MLIRGTSVVGMVLLAGMASHPAIAGSDIVVRLQDDRTVEGELLSARNDALLILSRHVPDSELEQSMDAISVLPYDSVQSITVEGGSYVLVGMGIGLLGGIGIGLAIVSGTDSFDQGVENVLLVTPLLGLTGLGLGAAIGSAASTDDIVIQNPGKVHPHTFRKYARFPDSEPSYLKELR
jgi:hypothetical protein